MKRGTALLLGWVCCGLGARAGTHPCLVFREQTLASFRQEWRDYPLMERSVNRQIALADAALATPVEVPVPVDPAGGYTHSCHRSNAVRMLACGQSYLLTSKPAYREYVRTVLLRYADSYPDLGPHPARANQAPGRLFWQLLNETVWLVQTIQAYDAVCDGLTAEDRDRIEAGVFRPMVVFILEENAAVFDLIHNHATWAAAAVGMCGMVMDEPEWVEQSLMGSAKDGQSGFLRQMDLLFSPDGYYAEGPYYQRYVLEPFMTFALALDNQRPEIGIFRRRDGVLLRAVETLLQLSDADGELFALNDCIKGKSLRSPEVVAAIAIAHARGDGQGNPALQALARSHGEVHVSPEGLQLAKAVAAGGQDAFVRKSMVIRDGVDGAGGAVVLLRGGDRARQADPAGLELVFKATTQGMGHGHFDRLSFIVHEGGREVLRDYGSARFINVLQKNGGRYLPENKTWAKQSVAHHVLVLDERSHFDGDTDRGDAHVPHLLYAGLDAADFQYASAEDSHAVEGWCMRRTLARFEWEPIPGAVSRAYVLDLLEATGGVKTQTADLPLYPAGEFIHANFEYEAAPVLQPLGRSAGYEHLWVTGRSVNELPQTASMTWQQGHRFYSWMTCTSPGMQWMFTLSGAGDPQFNLRREAGVLLRVPAGESVAFASVLEAHGNYDSQSESVVDSVPSISGVEWVLRDETLAVVCVTTVEGARHLFAFSREDAPEKAHDFHWEGVCYQWVGNAFHQPHQPTLPSQ
jgi:hypothetical protein